MRFSIILALASTLAVTKGSQYSLEDDYSGVNFLKMFDYWTEADPTQGHVKYVDRKVALQDQMLGVIPEQNNSVYMGVDFQNPSPEGRKSVRLTSQKSYNKGLFIADIRHMPGGICGTWPAYWLLADSKKTGGVWPQGGEIDILEGVNDETKNSMTLHTPPGCVNQGTVFSGKSKTSNCDIDAPNQGKNEGCGIENSEPNSYGTGFNSAGGGVYATEWNSTAISIWFFGRDHIPADISASKPNPAAWGVPSAQFGGGCDIDQTYSPQNIIFDTTFCGQWAGEVWDQSPTCKAKADSCEAYVANNPGDFSEAYWAINYVKVYQDEHA